MNLSALAHVLLGFLSIALVPAVIIAWLEGIRRNEKRKKILTQAQQV